MQQFHKHANVIMNMLDSAFSAVAYRASIQIVKLALTIEFNYAGGAMPRVCVLCPNKEFTVTKRTSVTSLCQGSAVHAHSGRNACGEVVT